MELLRRALLVGCFLPGLWLIRLCPLDPLLTVIPVDFAARQKQEAASVPDERKTEAERRRALIPLPVYVEEVLQYNVFSAVGPKWDRLLGDIDGLERGPDAGNPLRRRTGAAPPDAGETLRYVFFRPDEEPIRDVLDKLAQGGGTTYVSMSRPGEDRHYQVVRRVWSRRLVRSQCAQEVLLRPLEQPTELPKRFHHPGHSGFCCLTRSRYRGDVPGPAIAAMPMPLVL